MTFLLSTFSFSLSFSRGELSSSLFDRTYSRQEGRIIDKEEKLSGGNWRNRNSLSPFSPPGGSRGKRDAVTWRWISFSPRPISTDFHNGSTYECTHLSPTLPPPLPSQLLSLAYPPCAVTLIATICMSFFPFAHRNFGPFRRRRLTAQWRAASSRRDNCAGTWLIFGFASFYARQHRDDFTRAAQETRR